MQQSVSRWEASPGQVWEVFGNIPPSLWEMQCSKKALLCWWHFPGQVDLLHLWNKLKESWWSNLAIFLRFILKTFSWGHSAIRHNHFAEYLVTVTKISQIYFGNKPVSLPRFDPRFAPSCSGQKKLKVGSEIPLQAGFTRGKQEEKEAGTSRDALKMLTKQKWSHKNYSPHSSYPKLQDIVLAHLSAQLQNWTNLIKRHQRFREGLEYGKAL